MSSPLLSNFKLFSADSNKGSTALENLRETSSSPYNYKWVIALFILGITAFFYVKREDIKLALDQWSNVANSFLVKWWINASAGEWKTTYVPSDFFPK